MRRRRFRAGGAVALAAGLWLAQCGGPIRPTSMPANAPASVKAANACVAQRSQTSLVLVSGGGKGWWVQQGLGTYNWNTGTYSGGYDVYGWVETQTSTCPNPSTLGLVYDSGW